MKTKHWVAMILAIVLIPILCFFSMLGMFWFLEGIHWRNNLTTSKQEVIAKTLGFDIAPSERLTAIYQFGSWPSEISYLEINIEGIPSEAEFLSRCHEETLFYWNDAIYTDGGAEFSIFQMDDNYDYYYIPVPKEAERIIVNNRWQYHLAFVVFWGGLVAEPVLIATLIVNAIRIRRKSKKQNHPAGDGLPGVPAS